MNDIEKARQLVSEEYLRNWEKWYKRTEVTVHAKLVINISVYHSGYCEKKDTIHINLGEHDIKDYNLYTKGPDWPDWKSYLVHEMLHEYRYKVIKGKVTTQGKKLYKRHKGKLKFSGSGHDEAFFTAVANLASKFRMTPDQLVDNI